MGGPVCPACLPSVTRSEGRAASPGKGGAGIGRLVLSAGLLAGAVSVVALVSLHGAGEHRADAELLREAFANLAIVGTAAERHRGATGEWPASLDVLVPAQLSALPPDPFADGQPLRLGRDPLRPEARVIYSVGPNRSDEAGRPLDPASGEGDLVYPLD